MQCPCAQRTAWTFQQPGMTCSAAPAGYMRSCSFVLSLVGTVQGGTATLARRAYFQTGCKMVLQLMRHAAYAEAA